MLVVLVALYDGLSCLVVSCPLVDSVCCVLSVTQWELRDLGDGRVELFPAAFSLFLLPIKFLDVWGCCNVFGVVCSWLVMVLLWLCICNPRGRTSRNCSTLQAWLN